MVASLHLCIYPKDSNHCAWRIRSPLSWNSSNCRSLNLGERGCFNMSSEKGTVHGYLSILGLILAIFHSRTSSIHFPIYELQEASRTPRIESRGDLWTSSEEAVPPTISSCMMALPIFLCLFAYNSSGVGTRNYDLGEATGGYNKSCYGGTRVCLGEAPILIPHEARGLGM